MYNGKGQGSYSYATLHSSMVCFTHNLGMEEATFAVRLSSSRKDTSSVEPLEKFAGPVGSYGGHLVAYPDIKLEANSGRFNSFLDT